MNDLLQALKSNPKGILRIYFKDGESYVLRHVHDCSDAAGEEGVWNGMIVDVHGVSEERRKLFAKGSFVDFRISDIQAIDVLD